MFNYKWYPPASLYVNLINFHGYLPQVLNKKIKKTKIHLVGWGDGDIRDFAQIISISQGPAVVFEPQLASGLVAFSLTSNGCLVEPSSDNYSGCPGLHRPNYSPVEDGKVVMTAGAQHKFFHCKNWCKCFQHFENTILWNWC